MATLNGELSDSVLYRNQEFEKPNCSGNLMISLAACRELLERASNHFADQLQGQSAADYAGMSAEDLFGYLNWMNPIDSPHTMCGPDNLRCVRDCVESVLKNKVPGDLIETGVWKGGMAVLMRGILKAHNDTSRKVWVADSFEGLPKPDPEAQLKDAVFYFLMAPIQYLAIPEEYVRGLFQRYGLLDDQVQFLKGWFRDTLPKAPIETLSVIRMDGDFYESTRDTLTHLYPKLSPGGYLIVDDYGIPAGCKTAVDEYRTTHGIVAPIQKINDVSVFWQKGTSES